MAASEAAQEVVLPWLKTLPLAPEYRPSLSEFQDPISYIFKIEKEASKYGICKIVPPVPPSPKKTVIPNLNQSLLARNPDSDPKSAPTFTTRQQQIGFCPRKPRPVQRPVWQSGERYTFQEFEAKAKAFEKAYLKKCGGSGSGNGNGKKTTPLSALEIETLYWKATVDKPFRVEYANDMPGSAFVPLDSKKSKISSSSSSSSCEGVSLGETAWNMRGVSRANGSLLKFMKEEIPGVTSPMVYVAMMFSWFAWHVEDHDLHSLNYLHMGAGKTWYGVPREAAVAFEEVVRVHGYGGEINPLVTFATLGEKTTVMSPEVFIGAGVPCCRLVQNAGEFVVTFPRAYHTGFSHGFNCGEAANIATPEWLRVAKDAAIRRASINYPPMVSHFQLLYDLALALHSRMPMGNSAGPRSSRLKDKKKGEGETVVKELFAQNVVQNNELLHILGKGSSIVLLPRSSSDVSVCSKLRVGSQLRVNPTLTPGLCSSKEVNQGIGQVKSFLPVKGKFSSFYERSRISSSSGFDNICSSNSKTLNTDSERGSAAQGDGLSDQRLFSCVTCGILSFACVAIVQPREPASRYLMTADCSFLNDWAVGSGIIGNGFTVANGDAITSDQNTHPGWMEKSIGLFDVPVQSIHGQHQMEDQSYEVVSNTETQRGPSALGLLAMTYGNSSDSEDDQGEPDFRACADKKKLTNSSSESIYQGDNSGLPSMQDCAQGATGVRSPSLSRHGVEDGSNQTSDCSAEFRTDDLASRRSDGLMDTFSDPITVSHVSSDCSLDVHDVEQTKFGKENVPRENKNMSFAPRSDEDSSRMHVFCLEHAKEVEKQLRPIGGVHILLLCHPDYPKIVDDAKSLAEEMGIDYPWNNITFRDATKEDEDRIRSALDSQEAIPGNGDWAVKLGINLFYSANLSRSPLYSKQMPYNSVIYNAFGRCSPASSPKKAKVYRRRSGRQRKVVAGKWCGKVWMSHQVHPFLAKGDSDEEEEEDMSFQTWTMPDEKLEIKSESTHKSETTMVARKYGRKRKMTVESGSAKKAKFIDRGDAFFDYSAEDNSHQQGRTLRGKLAKSIERDEAVSDDSLDNYSHELQRTSKSKEAFFDEREDAVSDDSLIYDSHQQHRRIHRGKQSKCFDKEDAISDSSLGHNFHQHNRRIVKSKIRREAFSDDSLEGNSHQQIKRYNRRNQAKCIEREDAVLDDSLGVNSHKQQRRLPKIKQATSIEREDAVSDVPLDDDSHQQHRRILRSKPMRAEISQPMKKGPPRRVKKGTSWATKQVPRRPIKRESPQLMKQQTPRLRNNQSERNSSHIGLLVEEDQGGPSTRLRKRTKKTVKESEAKPKAKKQASRIKVRKNASVVKAPAGHNDPKIGDGEVEFLCDIEGCTMSFGSKHELVLHKRNVCPVKGCGKKFFSHKYLVQHRRVHLDERPLRCPWKGCKMTFKWAWARTEHIRVHTGARPYVCGEPGCGQTFRFVSDFSRHKRKTGHSAKKGR